MATIRDVASRAGVSVATVSNLLNRRANVSQEKHRRIMEAIEELNYRPNLIARNLKVQKTKFIVVMVPRLSGVYSQIYRGIASELEAVGYHILIRTTEDNAYIEEKIIEETAELGVSGIIMVPVRPTQPKHYSLLTRKQIPAILVERQVADLSFSSVVFDNHHIVQAEARRLFQQYGAENTTLVVGPVGYSSEDDCVEGFAEAYEEHCVDSGRKPAEDFLRKRVLRCRLGEETSFTILYDALLSQDAMPACFLVSNTGVAAALKEALLMMGHEAPIYALDGDVWRTSSAAVENPRKIGREALRLGIESAGLMMECLKNKALFENKNVVITPRERFSTTAVPAVTGTRKLNVLLLESPSADALRKMALGYMRRVGCEIEFEVLPYLDLHDQLLFRLSSGDSSNDVVMVDLPWISSFAESGFLVDFSGLMGQDRSCVQEFPEPIQNAFMEIGSRVYGLPMMATIQFLFYRKDLFEDEDMRIRFRTLHGFELSVPKNWTEFNFVAEFFNRAVNPSSPVEFGTAVNGLHPTGILDEFLPRQWAFNGRMLDVRGRLDIDSAENLRALENLCKTFSIVPPESLHYWWDEEFRQLIKGRLGMVAGFASHFPLPAETSANSEHYNDIAVAPIPGNRPMLGGWILGINSNSHSIAQAYSFVRWATNEANAVRNMLLGGAMPTNSTCDSAFLKLYLPWMADMQSSFAIAGVRETLRNAAGRIVNAYWFDTQVSSKLLEAMRGRTTPKQALVELEEILRGAKESKTEVM